MTGLTNVRTKSPPPAKRININLNNILNVCGYVLNLVVSYLGNAAGWFGSSSNAELFSKYQTLVTPSSAYSGYVPAVIFIMQGFFAASQILTSNRSHPLVQKGIGFAYFVACVTEAAWTILFAYEVMIPAFIAMVALLLALLTIMKMQWSVMAEEENSVNLSAKGYRTSGADNSSASPESSTRLHYWLLKFPFAIHAGWIAPSTILMLSIMLVSMDVTTEVELWVAVIGIAMIFGMCMGLLLRQDPGAPVYAFPSTVAYAAIGIAWELHAPSEAILARHNEASIKLVQNVAGFSGVCLIITLVSRWVAMTIRDQIFNKKRQFGATGGDDYIEASAI